jgi:phosphoribosylaminoimidazolecarboxamide formyltransferase/IMP cyclohydrolase
MNKIFLEVIIAPIFSKEALKVFSSKKNLRLLKTNLIYNETVIGHKIMKDLYDGFLIQDRDLETLNIEDLNIVTIQKPNEEEMKDLIFAFKVAKHVKSNAIIYAKNNATVGIGAGQMSRVYSAKVAGI